jgi:hypothetical protein
MLALLLTSAPGAAAPHRFRLRLPGPGQTTLGVAQFRFRGRAPRRLKLKLANRSRLGHSRRGLYAIYRRRRGRTTTLTLLTLLLHKQDGAASQARASGAEATINDFQVAIFFTQAGLGASIGDLEEGLEHTFHQVASSETGSTKPPAQVSKALHTGGIEAPPASRPSDLGDNVIDTGHYDDGHSFGWKSAGTKAAIGDWLHLSANNAPYDELIEEIERDIHADLDGDGEIGGSKGTSGGTIGTQVGAPVITGGP